MKFIPPIFAAMAFLSGCTQSVYPDMRDSRVVVENASLLSVVAESIDWWGEATNGDVKMSLGDKCDAEHSCVTVKTTPEIVDLFGEASVDADAMTESWEDSDGINGAYIQIVNQVTTFNPGLERVIIAHELGHALGLNHVNDHDQELMRPDGDNPMACIGVKTQAEYLLKYPRSTLRTVCY